MKHSLWDSHTNSDLLGKKRSKLAFLGKMSKMSISAPRLPPKVPLKGQLFWNDIITSIFTSYFNILLIHTKYSELLGKKRSKLAFLGKTSKMSISAPPPAPPKVPPKGQLFWNGIITSIFTSYFNIVLIHMRNSELLGRKRSKLAFLGKMPKNVHLPPQPPPHKVPLRGQLFQNDNFKALLTWNFNFVLIYSKKCNF